MKNVTILLAVVAMLAMAAPVQAATWTNTGTGEWNAANWGGTLPTQTDWANIYNGGTATITTGTNAECYGLMLGSSGGVVNMSGGTFIASGESIIDYNGGTGSTNEFNQSGGDVTLGSSSYTSKLQIGYGYGAGGLYSISGGTLTVNVANGIGAIILSDGGYGPGTFKVTGGNSTIDLNGSTYTHYDAKATLHAVVNASGLSTIDDVGTATFAGALIVEDNGAAAGTYTIMNYASHTGTFTVTKPSGGLWNDPVYGATSLTITKVPEPATMCLLAVGGIGVLIRRRRK